MDYLIAKSGDSAIVKLSGRLLYSDNKKFLTLMEEMLSLLCSDNVFDLDELDFIDSTGLGMLVIANDTALKRGSRIRLCRARGRVRDVIEIVEFATIMTVE